MFCLFDCLFVCLSILVCLSLSVYSVSEEGEREGRVGVLKKKDVEGRGKDMTVTVILDLDDKVVSLPSVCMSCTIIVCF